MTDNPIGEIIEAGTTAFVAQCLEVPRQITPKSLRPTAARRVRQDRQADAQRLSSLAPPLLGDGGRSSLELVIGRCRSRKTRSHRLWAGWATCASAGNAAARGDVCTRVWREYVLAGAEPAALSALGFADEDELRAQQPQIFELLRTEFSGLLIAYSAGDGKALRRHLPPKPPRIHSRVYLCDPGEVRALTEDLVVPAGATVTVRRGARRVSRRMNWLPPACAGRARRRRNDQGFLLRAGKTLAALLAEDYDRLQAILKSVI